MLFKFIFLKIWDLEIECETDPTIVSDQYLTKTEVREILAEAKKIWY